MKALTLHQPWASLIALGVKTIETRSWSTSYRGPLAIHAAARKPTDVMVGEWESSDFGSAGWEMRNPEGRGVDLPFGAIIATCELVDVVPMVAVGGHGIPKSLIVSEVIEGDPRDLILLDRAGGWWENKSDQRPFGDYAPGRYAWLLDGIVRLDKPIVARGRQGLWNLDGSP